MKIWLPAAAVSAAAAVVAPLPSLDIDTRAGVIAVGVGHSADCKFASLASTAEDEFASSRAPSS
jgi:hypothetical protein